MTGLAPVRDVLAATGPVFLDFDGPITNLFIDGRNQAIADHMRTAIDGLGLRLDEPTRSTPDPLIVLRWAYRHATPDQFATIEHTCIQGEIDATTVSAPTPGAHRFIQTCRDTGRPLVILTNNIGQAVNAYLDRHHLSQLVTGIAARIPGRPDLMKPHRALVDQAMTFVRVPPERIAFVGDSLTDLQVARGTGLQFIGFAKHPRRGQELLDAGSEATFDRMHDLADTARALGHVAHLAGSRPLH